jgi:hypothetical protein
MSKRRREVQPTAAPADAPTVMLRRGALADAPVSEDCGRGEPAYLQPGAVPKLNGTWLSIHPTRSFN